MKKMIAAAALALSLVACDYETETDEDSSPTPGIGSRLGQEQLVGPAAQGPSLPYDPRKPLIGGSGEYIPGTNSLEVIG